MNDWSRIGPAYESTIRTAALRPIAGRVADSDAVRSRTAEPVARAADDDGAGGRRAAYRIALGAGASGVPGGFDALTAQLAVQDEPQGLAFSRAGDAYRQSAARRVEIMRAYPPLDLSV